MLTSMQSAGVTPELNLRMTQAHKKGSTLALKPRADQVQNRGISGPTKRTYVLKNFLKSKKTQVFSNRNKNSMRR